MKNPMWTKLIHLAKRECVLNDENYRALLWGAAEVESASDITTTEQFDHVMDAFRRIGFKSTCKKPQNRWYGGKSDGHWGCTEGQQKKIQALWSLVARNNTEEGLASFVKRIAKVDSVRFLDPRGAIKVIIALRSMATKAGYNPDTGEKT